MGIRELTVVSVLLNLSLLIHPCICTYVGKIPLNTCVGIRELTGGNDSRYTTAFSLLFSDRSDLILCTPSQKNTHQWMKSFKKCDIPILVSIAGASTLTRSYSESDLTSKSIVSFLGTCIGFYREGIFHYQVYV